MSKAIEAMIEEGWSIARSEYSKSIGVFHTLTSAEALGNEVVVFVRPKPNAIVDWDLIDKVKASPLHPDFGILEIIDAIKKAP